MAIYSVHVLIYLRPGNSVVKEKTTVQYLSTKVSFLDGWFIVIWAKENTF